MFGVLDSTELSVSDDVHASRLGLYGSSVPRLVGSLNSCRVLLEKRKIFALRFFGRIVVRSVTIIRCWDEITDFVSVCCRCKQIVLATKRAMFDMVDKNTKQVSCTV